MISIVKKKKPTIIDLGANTGVICLYFKKKYPTANIVAVEADPFIFNYLKSNINNNNLKGIKLINKAAWINDKGVYFDETGLDSGQIVTNSRLKIPSLDSKKFLNQFESIDLLKIDIEGTELDLLKHIENELRRVNRIHLEYHSFKGEEQKANELLELLTKNGFRYYISNPPLSGAIFDKFPEKEGPFDLLLIIHAIKIKSS